MRRTSILALLSLVCSLYLIEMPPLLAQSGRTAESAKQLTAQERIAWRDIQAAIDEGIEAFAAKDLSAAMRLMAPDFAIRTLDGTALTREQAVAGMRQDLDSVLRVDPDRTYTRVTCLHLAGNQATVYTSQQYVRIVPDRKSGSPHEIVTHAKHRELWTFTKDGWLLKHIDETEQGDTLLDGEPYDPR